MTDPRLDGLVRSVASAPLTFGWLLILFLTTRIQRSAGRRGSKRIQRRHSTNLRRLSSEPSRVPVTALTGNAVLRPTFTEVGYLTAFVVGLAATPVVPDRADMPYPQADGERKMAS